MKSTIFALLVAATICAVPAHSPAIADEEKPTPIYGVEAPIMKDKTFKSPIPKPYDDSRDAFEDIDAAKHQAQREGKFVLVTFGANWCPDCRALSGMMQMPEFGNFMEAHFVPVFVDVGRYDRNLDVAEAVGVTDGKGIPTVVVLTPTGEMLNAATSSAWITSQGRDPQAALNYFARYAPLKHGDAPTN